jgi:hypothetical protein
MEGNYFLIKKMNHDTFSNCHRYVDDTINRLLKEGKIVAVKVEEYKHPRSLSANALYWMWMDDLAKLFNSKGMTISSFSVERVSYAEAGLLLEKLQVGASALIKTIEYLLSSYGITIEIKRKVRIERVQSEKDYTKDDCHDLCRSMFLSLDAKILSKTRIETLKSTRTLDSNEFCHYLRQIEQWSIEKLKHVLPDPADNQYRKWEQKQNE